MTNSQHEQILNFLLEVLQAILDNKTECRQVVYSMLSANVGKLNESFVDLLENKSIVFLSQGTPDAEITARVIVILSGLISECPFVIGYIKWEIAIAGYVRALLENLEQKFFTQKESAVLMNSLAIAYTNRIRGDKAENIEKAISWSELALQILTFDTYPTEWAMLQNTLANAYTSCPVGEKIKNLELAILFYKSALKIYIKEVFHKQWGTIQNGLGCVYLQCIYCGKRAEIEENRGRAITHLQNALQVRTREDFPQDWATTQNNLGVAYIARFHRVQAENYEQAITHLQNALQVRTREDFPQDWATTQHDLGMAYADRVFGDRTQNLKQAINCYENALLFRTHDNFPRERVETLFNLGAVYRFNKQFNSAYTNFLNAIETVEFLRSESVSGAEMKQKLLETYTQLYRSLIEVCLELAHADPRYYAKAVEYVERTKARNLADRLASCDSYSQNEINEKFSSLSFSDIQALLPDEQTVILEWYVLNTTFVCFIITRNNPYPHIWPPLQEQQQADLDALVVWVGEHLAIHYAQETQWQEQLVSSLNRLAKLLHIEQILSLLPESYERVILIPCSLLHLLPLHALPLANGSCLLDRFKRGVSYAPSCQLLQLATRRSEKLSIPNFSNLFAIQNPTNDLLFTNLEVAAISSYFDSAKILSNYKATKVVLNQEAATGQLLLANYVHFSCHGTFDFASPLKSALVLADAPLTLGEIFALELSQCRLVTLSACETGLTDFTVLNDEYIALPSGFLVAGSPSVVSSLWAVNDLSTAFLMIKFYENLQDSQTYPTVAVALNKAQIWLRDATKKELYRWMSQLPDPVSRRKLLKWIKSIEAETKPFESPYYWAAFCAIGQ
ncbi:CHAT domain-containing tetratricopeptide repeat protein [Microcoleus sp. D2_18a_D3]|uniref:CHAT domain-containing tetratricopeptide repeat protein n=1 Tax=Microcoleus sp. D2_18a_D3 TaxID=3055330 RepID=UPI002FCFE27B